MQQSRLGTLALAVAMTMLAVSGATLPCALAFVSNHHLGSSPLALGLVRLEHGGQPWTSFASSSARLPRSCRLGKGVRLSENLFALDVGVAREAIEASHHAARLRLVKEVGFTECDFASDILGGHVKTEIATDRLPVTGSVESYR